MIEQQTLSYKFLQAQAKVSDVSTTWRHEALNSTQSPGQKN